MALCQPRETSHPVHNPSLCDDISMMFPALGSKCSRFLGAQSSNLQTPLTCDCHFYNHSRVKDWQIAISAAVGELCPACKPNVSDKRVSDLLTDPYWISQYMSQYQLINLQVHINVSSPIDVVRNHL